MACYRDNFTFLPLPIHYKFDEQSSIYLNIVDFRNGSIYQWRELTVSFAQSCDSGQGANI
jgi:hypothetical protein